MSKWMKRNLAAEFTEVTGYTVTVCQIERWENFWKPIYDGDGADWLQYCKDLGYAIHEINTSGMSEDGRDKEWAEKWCKAEFLDGNFLKNVNPYLVTL
tara:strand:- start:1356 stop:1649 length:294 start_codon:yes stop_codon:yes gene_type:complete